MDKEQKIKLILYKYEVIALRKFTKIISIALSIFLILYIIITTTVKASVTTDLNNLESPFIKNTKIPNFLYVIDEKTLKKDERTMISSLQGIVSNKSNSQIYILTSSEPSYKVWLDDLKHNYNVDYKMISDPFELIDTFKNYINGYVLYGHNSKTDPSINNACSLASLNDALVITKNLESSVKSHGVTKIIGDCRNTDKNWAYKNLWNSGLNHSTVIELSPSHSSALRDYAIMTKSLVFYEDNPSTLDLREKIFSSMNSCGVCLGWGPDEFKNVSLTSKYGIDMVAADWSYNLTVLSAFPSNPIKQNTKSNIPNEKDVHYITIMMSDGDNLQWFMGDNFTSTKWYGSKNRGNFNLGWSISPSLYYLAPTVFKHYYKSSSYGKFSDYFVVSPSGTGYIYPSKFPYNKLDFYTERLNNYMTNVDQRYVTIIDDSSFNNIKLWNKYTKEEHIHGLFYLDYSKNNNYKGEVVWSNNKPVISCRDLIWGGLEEESEFINTINERINSGYTDITNINAYTFVYIHVWTKDMDTVQNVVNELNKNSKVRIVTPDTFMKLIKKNVKN